MQQPGRREDEGVSRISSGVDLASSASSPAASPGSKRVKLHFWQDSFSPHQMDLLRGASRHPALEVSQCVVTPISPARASVGWTDPGSLPWTTHVNPDRQTIESLLADDSAIHIHQGLRALGFAFDPLSALARSGRPFFCALERPRPKGPGAPFRMAKHAVQLRRLGRHARLLCIGRGTERWFRFAGAPASRLFPYAYFMDDDGPVPERVSADPIRFLFVGQLIKRKRVDLLIDALGDLGDRAWVLDIIGSGPERDRLVQRAAARSLGGRINFVGTKDRREVLPLIERSDVLVLPSDHDGWGAVIQEALNHGVPVVCSDNCGASVLVQDALAGRVFRAGDRHDLGVALGHILADVRDRPSCRQTRVDRMKSLTGDAGAEYLLSVVNSVMSGAPRPVAPWLTTSRAAS